MILTRWMTEIPEDKLLHVHAGNVVMLFGLVLFSVLVLWFAPTLGWVIVDASLGLVYLVAIDKERRDRLDPEHHTAELRDVLYTVYQPTLYTLFYHLGVFYAQN